jgi:hypothetical protein
LNKFRMILDEESNYQPIQSPVLNVSVIRKSQANPVLKN